MRANRLHWLNPSQPDEPFPDAENALEEPNGLLAIGGDLSTRRLLRAYHEGIFPWYNPDEPILWWSPDPRTIFAPDQIHVARSLRRDLRRQDYAVTLDRAFHAVIDLCAAPRRHQRGTWLGEDMRRAFCGLHAIGHAHSIEVWRKHALIGGLYGIALGRAFFGESMFSRAPNGSKIALIHLARQLGVWGFELIDGQVGSPHLYRMGAFDVPRTAFRQRLRHALAFPAMPPRWRFDIPVPADPAHLPTR